MTRIGVVLAATLMLAACARPAPEAAEDGFAAAPAVVNMTPPRSRASASLAYETDVRLQLPGEAIGARIDAVQQACGDARFGECAVLNVARFGGDMPSGNITVRIVPDGVDKLLALAGEGGELGSRTTRAEDLAQQVADNQMARLRLEKEHARLLAFQQRGDLKVTDLLALSQRMAEIEAAAEQAQRESAQQQRRIATQLLRIDYQASGHEQRSGAIGTALSESGQIFADSVAMVIRAVAGLLPVIAVLAVVFVLLRGWWRRRRR